MKKIILFTILALFVASCNKNVSPNKLTYVPVDIGENPDDGQGDNLRTAFSKINTGFAEIGDSLANIYTEAQTRKVIGDTIKSLRDSALVSQDYYWEKGDTVGGSGEDILVTETVLNTAIANVEGGSGSGRYEWTEFIVGTTTGSPANADTSFTISEMAGDVIELYRGTTADLHKQWLNKTATNGVTGYRYNSSGTIVVRPAWSTDDRAYIKAVPSKTVTEVSLTGGESSLLTGLVALWQLDESSGTNVADETGTFNLLSSADWGTGNFGNAAYFTRANSDVINTSGGLVGDFGTNDFSISVWVYVTTDGQYQGIMGNYGTYPYFYLLFDNLNHVMGVVNFADSNIEVESDNALSLNEYHNIIITCDRSGTMELYIDGVNQVDDEDISAHSAVNFLNASSVFNIGNIGGSYSSWFLGGRVDEVGIWTKVLSGDEITTIQTQAYPW